MLTKKEKVISSILCVISVILLIASLCFTTLLFTTHGSVMKAEAAVDITSDQYADYFSEDIYPNGYVFPFDETSFGAYYINGYSAQFDINNALWERPFRFDVAYRCTVIMDDGADLHEDTVVFFPSAVMSDGTLYYGFTFYVDSVYFVDFYFCEAYIKVDILCNSSDTIDTFYFSEVPSLTISSFYSSYESLYASDGWGAQSSGYFNTGSLDCFYGFSNSFQDEILFPCFLMIESNVGNLLVYFNPYLLPEGYERYRLVGIPNNFYTYCQYNESLTQDSFVALDGETFDTDFVFEFNNFYLVAPVPFTQSSGDVPSINESLGEVLLQGMTFGFDSIGEGITYTFNNLFLDEEGKLSTFTYVIVFTLGIGIVLGFIKWLLSYILSLGGKD